MKSSSESKKFMKPLLVASSISSTVHLINDGSIATKQKAGRLEIFGLRKYVQSSLNFFASFLTCLMKSDSSSWNIITHLRWVKDFVKPPCNS